MERITSVAQLDAVLERDGHSILEWTPIGGYYLPGSTYAVTRRLVSTLLGQGRLYQTQDWYTRRQWLIERP